MKTLGTVLRNARRKADLSLGDLADRADCSPSYLSRVERNERTRRPSGDLLARLAKALALPLDDLYLAAGRVPDDLLAWIASTPGVVPKLRKMQRAAA